MRIRQYIFFVPLFIAFYGISAYNQHLTLIENPFNEISVEQWVKESPLQYFIGYVLNLLLKNTLISYWLVVLIGFTYFLLSILSFEKLQFNNNSMMKILYFSPIFLILFYWMGKPDTFTIGSIFLLISYSSTFYISFLAILIMIFSHPQIAIVYLFLCKYLKLIKFRTVHFIIVIFNYFLYYLYYKKVGSIQSRYDFVTEGFERFFETIFTNSLAGFISYFMWLWVPIFASNIIKNQKFIFSFFLIFTISFFTLDHTRIFSVMSIPLIIFISKDKNFENYFNNIFNNKLTYILGIFQIQKRADGRIVDGYNLSENVFFQNIVNQIIILLNSYV